MTNLRSVNLYLNVYWCCFRILIESKFAGHQSEHKELSDTCVGRIKAAHPICFSKESIQHINKGKW